MQIHEQLLRAFGISSFISTSWIKRNRVLKSHGKDGRYLVLVVGPFANLSDDFMVLCDFLGARALKAINSWNNISPKHALAMNRHILVSHFDHLASLVWSKLIFGRFRDAVLADLKKKKLVSSYIANKRRAHKF